jgi:hypothetical protein
MSLMEDRKTTHTAMRRVVHYSRIIATRAALALCTLSMLGGHAVSAEKSGTCNPYEVAVIYEGLAELGAACRAIRDVVGYFQRINVYFSPKISIQFANRASEGPAGHSPAHGLFDPLQSRIVIYRVSDARPWGQAWSSKLVESFLRHEIVHLAVWQAVNRDRKRLRPEWHEFVAYAIQLELMDPDLRKEVLVTNQSVSAAKDLTEINEFSHGMNPEGFAVMAYKTYLERGGERFVRQLLNSEIIPPPFSYPFAVQPHEIRQ